MGETFRITIKIAGRNYPLNVQAEDEEVLRRVGKSIDRMIKDFESNYAVKDKQDALAMCALRLGTSAEMSKLKEENYKENTNKRLTQLNHLLEKELEAL